MGIILVPMLERWNEKNMRLAIFRIILLVLFSTWILNEDEFYDFLIFIAFGILGVISIFNLLFFLVFKKKLGSYLASICYLIIYALMLFDIKDTQTKALAEIDKNQTIFQSCCNRNSCEELGSKWTSKNNGVMLADIAGFGSNLHIYYIPQKNSYEVRTSVFFPPRYFSRFDCNTSKRHEKK